MASRNVGNSSKKAGTYFAAVDGHVYDHHYRCTACGAAMDFKHVRSSVVAAAMEAHEKVHAEAHRYLKEKVGDSSKKGEPVDAKDREVGALVDMAYDALEGAEDLARYHAVHGTPSLLILTQFSSEVAIESARLIAPLIDGKRVIEIGAGVGFLSIEIAKRAASVIAIESDPAWTWVFTHSLYRHKPANLTWIFGTAESVVDIVRGDIVIVATRSGVDEMRALAAKMAPQSFFLFQDKTLGTPQEGTDR